MIKVREMLLGSFMTVNVLLSTLGAVHIKTEFYPAGSVPSEYLVENDGADRTVIHIDGWKDNNKINVYENRSDKPKQEKVASVVAEEGKITWVISSLGYIPGFPVEYLFKDIKNKVQQEVEVIPYRIYVKSPVDNAEIEAKLAMTYPANYSIVMTGFQENEKIDFVSISYDEKIATNFVVNKSLTFMCMVGVIDKKGGVAVISFTRPSGEVLKLELPWGWEWMKYDLVYDQNGKPISFVDTPEFRKAMPKEAEYFDFRRNPLNK